MNVWIGVIVLIPCLFLGGWMVVYSGSDDPKNLHYLLWKQGLVQMDPNRALETMVDDPNRDSLVIGKSEDELKVRFGYLRQPSEASTYLRYCLFNSPWYGKTVKFLRDSNWMVVFKDGKVTDLVRAEGC
jgi:hypothetical protein